MRGLAGSSLVASTRRAEQRLGLAHEELVERVLARDEDREAVPAAPGPAPLLAQRGDRAGEADRDRAVELADVDPELERVGGRDAEQLALHQPPFDLPALRRRVPGAVGRETGGSRGVDSVGGEAVDQLRRLAALREADRAQPARDEAGHEQRRLRERARPHAELRVEQRRGSRARRRALRAAEVSTSTTVAGRPVSASASSPGFAIVADASRNCGSEP